MRSVSQHQFSRVPNVQIQRSSFDRSHGHKTTFDAGYLVPILVDEALPGDTYNVKMTGFARLATPIKPLMDNLFMETFFFAVPYRLIWENWEKFNGESDPVSGPPLPIVSPTIAMSSIPIGSLPDYFGLPAVTTDQYEASAFPFRAYNLIWNEWFRDQNLQAKVTQRKDDGTTGFPESLGDYNLLRRGKRHDYFTSCLPWPQKGEDITVPLGNYEAEVLPATENAVPKFGIGGNFNRGLLMQTTVDDVKWSSIPANPGQAEWVDPALKVDLSQTEGGWTINQLREAFQMQKMLERDARGGTRYTEVIRAHFGVTSPDARLQRPEFLGGGISRVNIKPVEQTTPQVSEQGTVQGNLAAYGTAILNNHGFTKSFTEHCIIIGLVNVRADLTYQQGINRMWSRKTRYDYFWPALAQIGEQAVYQDEIYFKTADNQERVFGYQERYAEYRYKPSQITGLFRSDAAQSLDVWHLSQDFETAPTLSEAFIEDNPPIDRVIAVQDEPHFLFDSHFSMKCARPMPLYGVPGNMDRF
ncbi:major capsid protein [Microviridae sp.]|nr:major capsid protein [Microviridae sp.]